jgi:hypothetical protein
VAIAILGCSVNCRLTAFPIRKVEGDRRKVTPLSAVSAGSRFHQQRNGYSRPYLQISHKCSSYLFLQRPPLPHTHPHWIRVNTLSARQSMYRSLSISMSQSQARPLASTKIVSGRNTVVLPNLSYPSRSYSDISWSSGSLDKRFSARSPPTLAFSYASAVSLPVFFSLEHELTTFFRLLPLAMSLRRVKKTLI